MLLYKDMYLDVTKSWIEVDDGHSVEAPALDHPVHQLPLTGDGVELKDVIRVGTVNTT